MSIIAKCMALNIILLITTVAVYGFPEKKKLGDPCIWTLDNSIGRCELDYNCTVLHEPYRAGEVKLNDIPSCGYLSANSPEMICCPNSWPTKSTTTPTIGWEKEFRHLASFAYYTQSYDKFVYHCTAIILSSNTVMATSKCVGNRMTERPSKVALGVVDTREYVEAYLEHELKSQRKIVNNDLALFYLNNAIDFTDKTMENVSLATLCFENELEDQPQLYAVGFAQNATTNCGLFQTRLERLSDCRVPHLKLPVRGIDITSTHICARAMPESSARSDGCRNCLTASSSVLHVERSDGSLCVAGIATPTTDECTLTDNPVLYTIFVGSAVQDLFGFSIPGKGPTFRNMKT